MKVQPYLDVQWPLRRGDQFLQDRAWRGGPCPHCASRKTGAARQSPANGQQSHALVLQDRRNRDHGVGGGCATRRRFGRVSCSIQVKNEAEAARAFNGLSKGGTVKMPPQDVLLTKLRHARTTALACRGMVVAMRQPAISQSTLIRKLTSCSKLASCFSNIAGRLRRGPEQSLEKPLWVVGGRRCTSWVPPGPGTLSKDVVRERGGTTGPTNDFCGARHCQHRRLDLGRQHGSGPVRGGLALTRPGKGWWGDNPPYHVPVFVLTHHAARHPITMAGARTFHFVTDGSGEAGRGQAQPKRPPCGHSLGGGVATISGNISMPD